MSLNNQGRLNLERSGPWIGVGGLFVMLWISISTTLYAPWWGLTLAIAMIVPQAILMGRWARERPARCPWIPVVGFFLWLVLVLVGVEWWGWRA
ncbi:MAG: hypothetical protein ABIR57_03320 [Aeromicrobium sp.]